MKDYASAITSMPDREDPWRDLGAHKAIFEWIEGWFNTRHRRSTLDYFSSAACEATAYTTTPAHQVV